MKKYLIIPETLIRKLAKANNVKEIHGKPIIDIVSQIIDSGYGNKLNHLLNQVAFTRNVGGFTVVKPRVPFPETVSSPDKFIKILIERELVPPDALTRVNWETKYDDSLRICGLLVEGNTVFINTVQKKTANRKNGWNRTVSDDYAFIVPIAIHFGNETIEYRCALSQLNLFESFVHDLVGISVDAETDRLTRLTKNEAEELKKFMQANFSSEHIGLPSTVGSIEFHAKNKYDLANDQTLIDIKKKLAELNLPSNDYLSVHCNLQEFLDPYTGITLPLTFEIFIKAGGIKFKSTHVTQLMIDNIYEAIIRIFLSRQEKLNQKKKRRIF